MNQDNWRLCRKCQGLFLNDGKVSHCPTGGAHDSAGSPDYMLSDTAPAPDNVLGLPIEATLNGYEDWNALSITSPGGGNVGINVVSRGTSQEGSEPSGVYAETDGWGTALSGVATDGTGVSGKSVTGRGVTGRSRSSDGVQGVSEGGTGVFGEGLQNGVHGKSASGRAIFGENTADGDGVGGFSESGTGVAGVSKKGSGVYARSDSGLAGYFQGHIKVTGEIRMDGADFAEEFCVPRDIVAGTVMVIDDAGALAVSRNPYDKRVAGVIAGAGSHRPGLILDSAGETQANLARRAISLIGKAYCHVDASQSPIGVGDLLTTAAVPGYAMRATDRDRAFGAVLGKALAPLREGRGLIPILVCLQ